MSLDRNRPFGTISGKLEECPTARFTQDGVLYNLAGEFADDRQADKAYENALAAADEAQEHATAMVAKAKAIADQAKAAADEIRGSKPTVKKAAVKKSTKKGETILTEPTSVSTSDEIIAALDNYGVEVPDGLTDQAGLFALWQGTQG